MSDEMNSVSLRKGNKIHRRWAGKIRKPRPAGDSDENTARP